MKEILIGRQPIFDRQLEVVGYELLYRDSMINQAQIKDESLATQTVLSRAFMEIGIDRLVGDKLAFVNLPGGMIENDLELPVSQSQLVFEILENIELNPSAVQAIRNLRNKGFQLAMDDVVSADDIAEVLSIVQIVKIDLLAADRDGLPAQLQRLRKFPVQILAEKVETEEEFQWCLEQGFDWFQGYFFCKPTIVSERQAASSAIALVQMLAIINSSDSTVDELERLVAQDVVLSYKIMRIINSAVFGLKANMTSLKQAIAMLGRNQLRSLLTLMLADHANDKPAELLRVASLRSEMAERLLQEAKLNIQGGSTVGLFSTLDAVLGMSMQAIMDQVPLAPEIKNAIVERQGVLGELLNCILAFEQGQWSLVRFHDLAPFQIQKCYMEAVDSTNAAALLLGAA